MPFALGWAISIFYVDTLPVQHAYIHFHSGGGAKIDSLSGRARCYIIVSVSIENRSQRRQTALYINEKSTITFHVDLCGAKSGIERCVVNVGM